MTTSLALAVAVLFAFSATGAYAADKTLTLMWDLNTVDDVAGYRIYQGRAAGGPYTRVAEVPHPTNTATVTITEDGLYSWVATAFDNAQNESGYSNEVIFRLDTIAPPAPNALRFKTP